jgi:hypothetical protein
MYSVGISETLLEIHQTRRCHISEDDNLHNHRIVNLKSHITGSVSGTSLGRVYYKASSRSAVVILSDKTVGT